MRLLYAFIVKLAKLILPILGWFNPKIKQFLDQRKSTFQDIGSWQERHSDKPVLWLHCASLGEYEMIVPLISDKAVRHNFEVVISFFSASGYKHVMIDDFVSCKFYLPIDDLSTMQRLLDEINPKVFVLVKYDFWLNMLSAVNGHSCSKILVNGSFRDGQFITSKVAKRWRNELKKFDCLFLQNEESKTVLTQFNFSNCNVSQDLRYDRVVQLKKRKQVSPLIMMFKQNDPLLILGSSWPEEEYIVQQYLATTESKLKVLIAPHDISDTHIEKLQNQFIQYNAQLFTNSKSLEGVQVMILDTIGHLSSAYQYADYAFIGGAFGKGLHNILEAAVWGLPIFTGPNIDKFPEAKLLQDLGVLTTVDEDPRHFIELFEGLKDDTDALEQTKVKLDKLFESRTGESSVIAQFIASLK